MGEFLRKLPLDVQFHNAFEEKLRRKLSMHNCFGFDRLDLEDGPNEFNLGELALAREIAGNLTSSELVQPTSFGDFTKLRSYWLEGIANYERDLIFNPQGYNEDKSKLNSYFLWTWILDTLGIVLEKEEDVF